MAITLLLVSLTLMTIDIRSTSGGYGSDLRSFAQWATGPVQSAINTVVNPIVDFSDALSNLAGLREENERLRDRIGILEREVAQVGHLQAELSELETLLALRLSDDLFGLAVPAEVTGRGGALDPTLTINQGASDGVYSGQPVVDGQGGLVGVVSESGPTGATIVLITSRRAPAVTVGLADGRRGVVKGLGAGTLELSILEADQPVEAGELLVTFGPYGDSNAYPKGLSVGLVAEDADPRFGTITARVEPLGELDEVEYVAVIPWPPAPSPLEEDQEEVIEPVDGETPPPAGQPDGADQ
ncbi:MAG: rod shape-determining protein MreC [Acidimicrobiia bacterium]|nr:rod shape-determining protein MreC [Acidimicrobiia bacterium]